MVNRHGWVIDFGLFENVDNGKLRAATRIKSLLYIYHRYDRSYESEFDLAVTGQPSWSGD